MEKLTPGIARTLNASHQGNEVVAPVASAVPEMATQLFNTANSIDTEVRKEEVREGMQENLDKFNQDMETDADTNSRLDLIAKNDPQLKRLTQQMKKLAAAGDQGVASSMLQFRAEASLKEAIARAPGLRNELRGVAMQTLGFDPTGATIKALMAKPTATADPNKGLRAKWQDYMLKNNLPVADKTGNPLDDAQLNQQYLIHSSYNSRIDRLEETTSDTLQGNLDAINGKFASQAWNINQGFVNLSEGVQNEADFKLLKTEGFSEARTFANTYATQIEKQYARIPLQGLSEADIKSVESSKRRALAPVNSMLEMLDSKDMTEFGTAIELVNTLDAKAKLDFTENFPTAARMVKNFSGFVQGAASEVLSSKLQLRTDIGNVISQAITGDQQKKVAFNDYLDVMQGQIPFENLDVDRRRDVATNAWSTLKYAVKNPELALAADQNVEEVGRAYAVVLQSFNPNDPDEQREAQALLVSDAFIGIQDKVAKLDGGTLKAEMIADTGTAMVVNYMTGAGLADANEQASKSGKTIEFNIDTGSFFAVDSGVADRTRQPVRKGAQRKIEQIVDNLNKSAKAFNSYRMHDELLKGMSKEDALQYAVHDSLKAQGIKIHGNPKDLTQETPSAQRKKKSQDYKGQVEKWQNSLATVRAQMIEAGLDPKELDTVNIDEASFEISEAEDLDINIQKAAKEHPAISEMVSRRRGKVSDEAIWEAIQLFQESQAGDTTIKSELAARGKDLNK